MFNSLRTAAAKLTRSGSGSGSQPLSEQARASSEPQEPDQIVSAEQADTLGDFQSFPPRSSISRDKGRRSVDGRKPNGSASSSGLKVQIYLVTIVCKQTCLKTDSSVTCAEHRNCYKQSRRTRILQFRHQKSAGCWSKELWNV